jgi:hypothetical protein
MRRRFARRIALVAAVGMVMGLFASPAFATKPDSSSDLVEGHKIWICHATRSLSNPYVKILIDIAAWDIADPDSNDHGPQHHLREKDGVVWGDYALENAEDECSLDVPPPPQLLCPDGSLVDYVVEFDGSKLTYSNQTLSANADIPAGTYDVILGSGDVDRGGNPPDDPLFQPHESWRLAGDTPTAYTPDLADDAVEVHIVTGGLTVVFNSAVSQVTAQHWSVVHTDDTNPNSVIPEFACLTETGGTTPPDV